MNQPNTPQALTDAAEIETTTETPENDATGSPESPDDLVGLSTKDLRRLAGENRVPGRSRLGRKALLMALREALTKRQEDLDFDAKIAAVQVESEPAAKPDESVQPPVAPAPVEPVAEAAPEVATVQKTESEPEPETTESAADNSEPEVSSTPVFSASSLSALIGLPLPPAPIPAVAPAPAPVAAPIAEKAPEERPQQRPAQAQTPPPAPQQQYNQGPRKPRLDGPQRPLPNSFDRLRRFAKGLLEFCDPDTPVWAQARISELLAEAGLVPTPAQGEPHSQFHEVVGEVTSAIPGVKPGEIAQIVSPGFCLRGDRGDLFALRPAKVRVNPGGTVPFKTTPVQEEESPKEVVQETAKDVTVSSAPIQSEVAAVVPEAPRRPMSIAEAAIAAAVAIAAKTPMGRRAAEKAEAAKAAANGNNGETTPAPAQEQTSPIEDEPSPGKALATETTAPSEGASSVAEHHQSDRRPAHRVRSSDVAPTLPLVPIDAEELAAKPKAEGFRALGLNEQILADLAAMGWQDPTPVQAGVISLLMSGKDVIGQAQTGSGKTGAFVLPILNKLYSLEGQGPIALILCPTRELARQVHSECIRMAGTSGARATVIYGGVSLDDQVDALARQPHIVVGTPGRIIDHIRRRTLDLSRLKIAVMDEADQMLDIGFLPDIEFILKHTPPSKQVMLFSATMPPEILALVNKFMKDQQHINLLPIIPTVEQVDQKYIAVDHDKKTMLLAHFIEQHNPERLLVFCRTKHQVDRVTEVLKRKKMKAAAIHGDLPQSKREKTLEAFRNGEIPSMVATNVAARGLDIPTVSHVVNYDIPETPEEYVHRIGRTARNGAPGIARTFVTPEDGQFIVGIEKHIGLLLEEEIVEGITVSTATAVVRTIAQMPIGTPKLLKPIIGGIKLGRRRR